MTELAPPKFGMGAPVRRLEDVRLITGRGRYTADMAPENALEAFVVRSPYAHARFSFGDLSAAKAAPGVHLVWTAADIAEMNGMPVVGKGRAIGGRKIVERKIPPLCAEVARYVGDAVAFVVADNVNLAKSAAELLEIDYEPLPAVVACEDALKPDAAKVWSDDGQNLSFECERGDRIATEEAFARADRVAKLRIVNNRLVCNYMEPRAVVADYDTGTGKWTIIVGSQGVHDMQENVAKAMGEAKDDIRVLTYDVGGGFGTKAFTYREYPLCAKAAKVLERPVTWVCERGEHFLTDAHGRDNVADAAMALDKDGRFIGMKVDLVANMGAYLSQFAAFIPWLGMSMTTGVYDIPAAHIRCDNVFTHTVPVDAYRGAGRPEAAYLIERLVDEAARVCGLSRAEIRRRNFIKPEQMPYRTQMDRMYDTGEFDGHLSLALEHADKAGFAARAEESKRNGKVRGFGFGTYVEACAFAGSEAARVNLEADGTISVHIGTQSNGQGHETAYAQFAAGPLGVDYDRIRVVQGDTDDLEVGGGTGGSRSIPLGVPSVDRAARTLAVQLRELASDELEASAADIELVDGEARIVGTDRSIGFAELAAKVTDKQKLHAYGAFEQGEATYPNGTHVCELEIDPQTGHIDILRYLIVDDFGAVVNPLLLAGQVHGGVVQGIGQAMLEHTVHDGEGQLISASFNDYAMPRADDIPDIEFETRNVPSTWNPMGIKGAGEAGSIGSCPAVVNAIIDGLAREYGIRHIDMPATPLRVWEAIRAAGHR